MNHIKFDLAKHVYVCEVCGSTEKVIFPTSLDEMKKIATLFIRSHRACLPHQKGALEKLKKVRKK